MRIRWTRPAARDLSQISDYIEEHAGGGQARRISLSIYERVSSLAGFPEKGRLGRLPGTRELILPGLPYIAIYRVKEESVELLRILHGAQRWP